MNYQPPAEGESVDEIASLRLEDMLKNGDTVTVTVSVKDILDYYEANKLKIGM